MTSILTRPIWFALGLAIAALVAALAIGSNNTSALSQNAYLDILERNGYHVTLGDAVDHDTLGVDGRVLIVELNGRKAAVEFLDYGTQDKLKGDFIVVDGEGPRPIKATDDFDGKVLYWFNDSVLVVDYNAPNDAIIARAAANSYLGLPGEGGEDPNQPASPTPTQAPGAGSPTKTPSGLPNSGGDPGDADTDGNAMALGLALIAAGSLAAAVVLIRQRRTES